VNTTAECRSLLNEIRTQGYSYRHICLHAGGTVNEGWLRSFAIGDIKYGGALRVDALLTVLRRIKAEGIPPIADKRRMSGIAPRTGYTDSKRSRPMPRSEESVSEEG
jgi:hypothetical protein